MKVHHWSSQLLIQPIGDRFLVFLHPFDVQFGFLDGLFERSLPGSQIWIFCHEIIKLQIIKVKHVRAVAYYFNSVSNDSTSDIKNETLVAGKSGFESALLSNNKSSFIQI